MSAKALRTTKIFTAAGVLASIVGATLLNIAVARHYTRWDLTTHKLYTLSEATTKTLESLEERIQIDVLLPSSDPIAASVRFLLNEYEAKTSRLDIRYTDPDRNPAEFLALQQKYGIEAGRTEDGQVVMDASIVISRSGKKPFFLSSAQFVDWEETEAGRARSRLEQALTGTIRRALSDERPTICFTTGHGEMRIDDGSSRGLADFVHRLHKNNYEVEEVEPGEKDALKDCRVTIIAGPSQPFAKDEAERLRAYAEGGGNLFLLANPVPDGDNRRFLRLGLNEVTEPFGIALEEAFVFETDARRKLPIGVGEQFFASVRHHDITRGLLETYAEDLRILFVASRPLSASGTGSVAPVELLSTSEQAFGMRDFFGWAERGGLPEREPGDHEGPIALAMAAELPKPSGSQALHGPRIVVVGSSSLLWGQSFREPALRGGAIFAENALSWLAARPPILDIPDKPAAAGLRIDESSLGEVLRYVILYMPAAVGLLGIAVFLRRRATSRGPKPPAGKGEA